MEGISLLFASGERLVVQVLDVPSDGACFFHCIIAGLLRVSDSFFVERQIPCEPDELRRFICEKLRENPDVIIPGLGISPHEYFLTEYSDEATKRRYLHNSFFNKIVVDRGQDPHETHLYVDSFAKYLQWMEHPNTQCDDLVVAFTAFLLGLNMTVFKKAISEVSEYSEIPQVKQLISMGFKKSHVEEVLARTQGNVEQALEILLQMDSASAHVQQRAQEVWHAQYYPNPGIQMCLINEKSHFQLVVPDEVSDAEVVYQQAQVREKKRLQLPDIPEDLLVGDVVSNISPLIRTSEELYEVCLVCLQKCSKIPTLLRLDVRIDKCTGVDFCKSLLESFVFPECGMLKYRIVCFTFDDETKVAHDGSIDQLSHRGAKIQFFTKLWESITLKSVTRVVFERC